MSLWIQFSTDTFTSQTYFFSKTIAVKKKKCQHLSVWFVTHFTCVGDFLSCRLGLTLRKPLAARDELLASPFLRPSVTLRDRQESKDKVNNINVIHRSVFWFEVFLVSCRVFCSFFCHVHCQDSPPEFKFQTYPSLTSENHSLRKKENTAIISDRTERMIILIPATNVNAFV